MKTTIVRNIALSLATSLMAIYAIAQQTNIKNEVAANFSYYNAHNAADKSPFSINSAVAIKPAAVVPSEKVFQEFQKKFSDATNVSWSPEHNGSYHAFFWKDGSLNAVLLNKNGKILYLINYLSADQLPSDIKMMVRDNYNNEFKIADAAKISVNSNTVWIITLIRDNHYVIVRTEDGQMDEIKKFKVAD